MVNIELTLKGPYSETSAIASQNNSTHSLEMKPVAHKTMRLFGVDIVVPDGGKEKEPEASSSETTLSNSTSSESSSDYDHGDSQHVNTDEQEVQLHEFMPIGDDNNRKKKRKIGELNSAGSSDENDNPGKANKGVKWSDDEHQEFLRGLKEVGKGKWKPIAINYVKTRTPSQVASHAQKHFQRFAPGSEKKKKRCSIFDTPFEKQHAVGGQTPDHDSPVPLRMIKPNSPPPLQRSENEIMHQQSQRKPISSHASPSMSWQHAHRPVMVYVPMFPGHRGFAPPYGSWQANKQLQQPATSHSSELQEAQSHHDDPAEAPSPQSSPKLAIEVV